jgi:hypothetical protein
MMGNIINLIHSYTFGPHRFPSLQYLSLSGQINQFASYFIMDRHSFANPSLKELYLQENNIVFGLPDFVSADVFADCSNLKTLGLSKTDFRHVDDNRFFALFGKLQSLETLLLSDSQFESVSEKTFAFLTNLHTLDLKGNLITRIPAGTFDSLTKLKHLDVSNNRITVVTEQTFSEAMILEFEFLGLSGNPFLCTCDLFWFKNLLLNRKSLTAHSHALTDFKQAFKLMEFGVESTYYKCDNLGGLNVTEFGISTQACILSEQASVLIIYTCTLFIVMLTTFLLLYAYRWHLRLMLYEAFRGRGDARRRRLQQNTFDYDVFVSYASEDLTWVRHNIMSEMEPG